MGCDIKSTVDEIIKKYDTRNPFEIAEAMGIHIMYNDLGSIRGFYRYRKRNMFIVINSSLNERSQYITCAHELGHAVKHTKVNTPFLTQSTFFSKDRFEIEANKFAAELIIDETTLDKEQLADMTLEQLSCFFYIPKELILYKFDK